MASDEILHTLWSKAVDQPGYVKAEWQQLERLLWDLVKARDEACGLAEEYLHGRNTVVTSEREAQIAALRRRGIDREPNQG